MRSTTIDTIHHRIPLLATIFHFFPLFSTCLKICIKCSCFSGYFVAPYFCRLWITTPKSAKNRLTGSAVRASFRRVTPRIRGVISGSAGMFRRTAPVIGVRSVSVTRVVGNHMTIRRAIIIGRSLRGGVAFFQIPYLVPEYRGGFKIKRGDRVGHFPFLVPYRFFRRFFVLFHVEHHER